MIPQNLATDCQFCSVVSKANGEDPIGTANPFSQLFVMEITQPWTEARLLNDPILKQLHDFFHELHDQQNYVAVMAIAPDREYTVAGFARVMYYQRPAPLFAQLDKQEFLIPEEQLPALAIALFQQPNQLPQFTKYQLPPTNIREIMVCTHGNVDIACARFGQPIYQQLRQHYASDALRIWRCSHFGGHQFAPTLIDLPTGQVWGHLEPEILPTLVQRMGEVSTLRSFYRGWVGLTKFAQMVEREIWMQQGWDWLHYLKAGQVIAQAANHPENPDWAEVRLEYTSPEQNIAGAYTARVSVCGSVITAFNSGEAPRSVQQYQVSHLVHEDLKKS